MCPEFIDILLCPDFMDTLYYVIILYHIPHHTTYIYYTLLPVLPVLPVTIQDMLDHVLILEKLLSDNIM